jgi:hypothetical protein
MKKLILAAMLCCTLSAVSNANWLSFLFPRFVNGDNCKRACNACIWSDGGGTFACAIAKKICTCDECPSVCYLPPEV